MIAVSLGDASFENCFYSRLQRWVRPLSSAGAALCERL